MATNAGPFAGLKLSEQTTAASPKLDQRLFDAPPPKAAEPARMPTAPVSAPAQSVTPVVPTKPAASTPAAPRRAVPKAPTRHEPRFDFNATALIRASYQFTQEELNALEDLKLELRRELDSKITKNDLVRTGLHLLFDDYTTNGSRSLASQRARKR